MATATQTDVDLMEQARQLQDEATTDEQEYREFLQQANERLAARNEKLKQAGELLTQASEMEPTEVPMNGTPAKTGPQPKRPNTSAVRPATPTPKRPGTTAAAPAVRPAAAKPIPARPAVKATPATPAKPVVTRKAKVEPHERNYGQDTSLRKEIWSVLDREPASYKQYLPDYPEGAVGLKVSEVKEIIEQEGKWTSKAENISPQIQGHLHDLKKDGKIHRNDDDRRYFIVDGATLGSAEEVAPAA